MNGWNKRTRIRVIYYRGFYRGLITICDGAFSFFQIFWDMLEIREINLRGAKLGLCDKR